MDRNVFTNTVSTTSHEIAISRSDIIKAFGLPDNAKVFIGVPGGGDWSNIDLDVDDAENQVFATWKIVTEAFNVEDQA